MGPSSTTFHREVTLLTMGWVGGGGVVGVRSTQRGGGGGGGGGVAGPQCTRLCSGPLVEGSQCSQ